MRDGTGKLPTPDSHVDGENGAKIMVYSMKREFKERGTREKQKKKKKKMFKKYFFPPTLYKFIVRACWAWVHSCFGVQAKTGSYNRDLH